MVDFFTNIYSSIKNKNSFLTKVRFYSFLRVIVRQTANIILPVYFKYTKNRYKITEDKTKLNNGLIVSFTSFPARIKNVHLVVESILRQTVLPDRIILWLSKDQFPTIDSLPKKLLEQRKRGLEINLCEGDLRSYKKFYYTVRDYPDADFIIIDDDSFYPSDTIETLKKYNQRYPHTVCFNKGRQVNIHGNMINNYKSWQLIENETEPRFDIMATGVGGVYYPANILNQHVLNEKVFMKICKYADDIWLYAMTLLNDTKLVKTNNNKRFVRVEHKNNSTLASLNVGEGLNDAQIKDVRDYFINEYNIDPFKNIFD
jgi:hypothetical protein